MNRRRLPILLPAGIGLVLTGTGCSPSALDGGFESPNPAAQLYAIEDAARSGDREAIPDIVASLDSDDPAVRLVAIGALEALTGETLGYEADAPEFERDAAIERWVEYAARETTG